MAECFVIKRIGPVLTPAGDDDKEALDKLPQGQALRISFVRSRNIRFHRKWFALARLAFDLWEPENLEQSPWKGVTPEKSFDRFRKDLIILAGFSEVSYRLDGTIRVEAKSIAFDNMPEDEFERVYSKTIDVVLKNICKGMNAEELQTAVDEVLSYAGN